MRNSGNVGNLILYSSKVLEILVIEVHNILCDPGNMGSGWAANPAVVCCLDFLGPCSLNFVTCLI